MKPITTPEDIGKFEEQIRTSERTRIASFISSCREDDTDRPRVQVFDWLAKYITAGKHWVKE